MGNPNSDSANNNTTLNNFFTYCVAGSEANLLALFSPDAAGPPQIPSVGIANHGSNFKGSVEVKKLFDRLFPLLSGFNSGGVGQGPSAILARHLLGIANDRHTGDAEGDL